MERMMLLIGKEGDSFIIEYRPANAGETVLNPRDEGYLWLAQQESTIHPVIVLIRIGEEQHG